MDEQLHAAVTDLWTEILRLAREQQLHSSATGSIITVALQSYGAAQAVAERERCAEIVEQFDTTPLAYQPYNDGVLRAALAAAIREQE